MNAAGLPYLRVADFEGWSNLSDEEFGQRFGAGFLLHHGELGSADAVESLDSTTLAIPSHAGPRAGGAGFLVFPIRLSGRTAYSHFVSVGRAANNDLVLADPSISLFHALIKISASPDGRPLFLVQDAASKNGSFVSDQPVPRQDAHEHATLEHSGTAVRFGTVELTFLFVHELRKLLKGIKR